MTEIMVLLSEKEFEALWWVAQEGKDKVEKYDSKEARLMVRNAKRALQKMVTGRNDRINSQKLNKLRIKNRKKS